MRWKSGETGPRLDDWSCLWCGADDSETPRRFKELCATCHGRRANGATGPRAEDWRCDWCETSETRWRAPGPNGPSTLCRTCYSRWREGGETGPRSADWNCDQCGADDSQTTRCKGPNGPATACKACSGKWNASGQLRRRAEPDHLAAAFARRPA